MRILLSPSFARSTPGAVEDFYVDGMQVANRMSIIHHDVMNHDQLTTLL